MVFNEMNGTNAGGNRAVLQRRFRHKFHILNKQTAATKKQLHFSPIFF